MVPYPIEVGVLPEPFQVVVAKLECCFQRLDRIALPVEQTEAASKIVANARIGGEQSNETSIDPESLLGHVVLGIEAAEQFQDLKIRWIPLQSVLEEVDVEGILSVDIHV